MSEEVNLVSDLALILISAGVVTIISKALKQPLILGYLVAGFLVGPHLGIFYTVSDIPTIKQWSDIGIIFLLFALGLEFSFKKLIKVGASALLTAGTTSVGMLITGILVGTALKWSTMECIFLGGLMSMSSTTIIIKAYDELGYKNKPFAPLVFGTLVVEDIIAVLLLVLLSTLAVSQDFSGGKMVLKIAELGFFIILWFLVGIYVIPILLKKAKKFLNDEILLIVSIGLCFLMVKLATLVGFSSALGAFVMGSILSETLQGDKIGKLLVPIKNLFGAIFFVSVGMMIDPAVIAEHWLTILILTFTAMLGIITFSTAGALLSRQDMSTAFHMSFSLAQLGEFSFIIAGLGCSMGVMRQDIYPIIITVSVITTFTTPYMIKAADPFLEFLNKKLPAKWIEALNPSKDQKEESSEEKKDWKLLLKNYVLRVVLYSVIVIAILLGSNYYLIPLADKYMTILPEIWRKLVCLGIELVALMPFLYGLGVSSSGISAPGMRLLKRRASSKFPILLLILIRAFIAVYFLILAVWTYFDLNSWALLLFIVFGVLAVIIFRRVLNKVSWLEQNFMDNLNAKEKAALEEKDANKASD